MTRPVPHKDDGDTRLRDRLRAGLDTAPHRDSEALQDRVMAQWRQRHPVAEHATAGGPALRSGAARRPLWFAASALLVAAALAFTASWPRPDPVMEELMQLDVLSQMALGEI
jgi:hypothetical protein